MCSSPKSNGCYVPPKKPTRSILAGFSAAQRKSFAATANKAQALKEQRLQLRRTTEVRATQGYVPPKQGHHQRTTSKRLAERPKTTLQRWTAFFFKLGEVFEWSNWWRAREL